MFRSASRAARVRAAVVRAFLWKIVLAVAAFAVFGAFGIAGERSGAVARVNGVAVTQKELDAELQRLIPQSTFHGTISEERRREFRDKAVRNLIEAELIHQDAVARGMKAERKAVKEHLKAIKKKYGSQKAYTAALEQEGISEDVLMARIRRYELVHQAFRKIVIEPSVLSDEALSEKYEKNKEQYRKPEAVRLSIISTKNHDSALEALAKLAEGADFGEVAVRYSEDVYRFKGGDVGYIHRGRFAGELEDEAFKLRVGEVSGIIRTDENWVILKLEDRKPARMLPFDEIRDKLKNDLEKKRQEELKDTWIAELKAKAQIEFIQR